MSRRQAIIPAPDLARLRRFLATYEQILARDREQLELLREKCERAVVVEPPELPQTAMTLHTQVRLRDLESGRPRVCTVDLPSDAQLASGRRSPLSWLGAVLLGLREGDEVLWQSPTGQRRLRVEKVLHQPEAARRQLRAYERRRRQSRVARHIHIGRGRIGPGPSHRRNGRVR